MTHSTPPTPSLSNCGRYLRDPNEWAESVQGTWLESLYDFAIKLGLTGVDFGEVRWWTDQAAYQGMGWVRQGLILSEIFRSHKWREDELEDGLPPQRWGDWCAAALKMSAWSVRKLMDGARLVRDLMDEGFTVLPRCLAQAEALIPYWRGKKEIDLFEAWAAVMEDHPLPQHITANSIKGALGEVDPPKKRRIGLSKDTYEALRQRAALEGISAENMIRDFLGMPHRKDHRDNTPPNLIPDPAPPEPEPYPEPEPEAVETWENDLQTLITENNGEPATPPNGGGDGELYPSHGSHGHRAKESQPGHDPAPGPRRDPQIRNQVRRGIPANLGTPRSDVVRLPGNPRRDCGDREPLGHHPGGRE